MDQRELTEMFYELCKKVDRMADIIEKREEKDLNPFCCSSIEAAKRIGLSNTRYLKYYLDKGLLFNYGKRSGKYSKKELDKIKSLIESGQLKLASKNDVYGK